MSKSTANITAVDVIKKVPFVAKNFPQLIRGLAMSKLSNKKKPIGLGKMLEASAVSNPDNIAIYNEDYSIDYQNLNSLSNQAAHYFTSLGLAKGDPVCLFIDNRIELFILVAGLSKIGAVSALINTSHSGEVLEHSFNLIKPKFAIIGQEHKDEFNKSKQNITLNESDSKIISQFEFIDGKLDEKSVQSNSLFAKLLEFPIKNHESSQKIFYHDPAFYIFTSGTTGLPKAAVFTHGRIYRISGGFGVSCLQSSSNDIMYVPLPFFHSTAMVVCWSSALISGSSIVVRKKFSASSFWDDCRKFKVTSFGYIGELCRYLLDQPATSNDKNHNVIKIIGNGLNASIWMEFKERFNINRIHEFYGASEGNIAFINVFNFDETLGFTSIPHKIVRYDSEGQPVRNNKGLLDEVPKGTPGLLLSKISKSNPYDGYTEEGKTNKTIIRDAFKSGDAWFNTGDIMKSIGFNHTQFVDRLGDTFRWKGENVSTAEVENILHKFEHIKTCIAYGVTIPKTNGKAGMLAINLESENFNSKEFLDYAKESLPLYAIPIFLRITKTTLATTDTFKLIKSDLRKQSYTENVEEVYIWLPKENEYKALTQEIIENLDNSHYRY